MTDPTPILSHKMNAIPIKSPATKKKTFPAFLPTLTRPIRLTHNKEFVIGLKPSPYKSRHYGLAKRRMVVGVCLVLMFLILNSTIFPISGTTGTESNDEKRDFEKRQEDLKEIREGATITCKGDVTERVYRFTRGMRRWYPSEEVRLFWAGVVAPEMVDCSAIEEGTEMTLVDS